MFIFNKKKCMMLLKTASIGAKKRAINIYCYFIKTGNPHKSDTAMKVGIVIDRQFYTYVEGPGRGEH